VMRCSTVSRVASGLGAAAWLFGMVACAGCAAGVALSAAIATNGLASMVAPISAEIASVRENVDMDVSFMNGSSEWTVRRARTKTGIIRSSALD
jgi:hypothetical protein